MSEKILNRHLHLYKSGLSEVDFNCKQSKDVTHYVWSPVLAVQFTALFKFYLKHRPPAASYIMEIILLWMEGKCTETMSSCMVFQSFKSCLGRS